MTEAAPQQQPVKVEKRLNRKSIIGLWPAALAIFVALVIVRQYVRIETPCYWSDFNYYEWATRFSGSQLAFSPLNYPLLLLLSVKMQHNLYFTVPLVPLMAALGGGRFAYVASTTIVYLLPLAYVIARLARTLLVNPD